MKILADENIPHIKELFSEFATIVTCEGRNISNDKLIDVDVLLVRSVTKVNKELLENTAVKFVGTATIGVDHLDMDYLNQQNITFSNAKGCNTVAVAEYVLSGLFVIADKFKLDLRKHKVGIIGAGNVGTAISNRLELLSIPYCLYDPPLQEKGDKRELATEKELMECEFVTVHVPLTSKAKSQWPTENMIDSAFFDKMTELRYFINTARGDILDPEALKKWLGSNTDNQCIIDVWPNEPNIDCELLKQSFLSTPHIAGHTREGKSRGTLMLFHAFCEHFSIEDTVLDDS